VESDFKDESRWNYNSITGVHDFDYSVYRNDLRFRITRKALLRKKCFTFKAYDLYKEAQKFVPNKYKSPVYVRVQDDNNSRKYAVKYFFL